MSEPIKTSVRMRLEDLKNISNITTNPKTKENLKKKILKLEKELELDDSIYKI